MRCLYGSPWNTRADVFTGLGGSLTYPCIKLRWTASRRAVSRDVFSTRWSIASGTSWYRARLLPVFVRKCSSWRNISIFRISLDINCKMLYFNIVQRNFFLFFQFLAICRIISWFRDYLSPRWGNEELVHNTALIEEDEEEEEDKQEEITLRERSDGCASAFFVYYNYIPQRQKKLRLQDSLFA